MGLEETDGFGDTNTRKRTNTQIDSWRFPGYKTRCRRNTFQTHTWEIISQRRCRCCCCLPFLCRYRSEQVRLRRSRGHRLRLLLCKNTKINKLFDAIFMCCYFGKPPTPSHTPPSHRHTLLCHTFTLLCRGISHLLERIRSCWAKLQLWFYSVQGSPLSRSPAITLKVFLFRCS